MKAAVYTEYGPPEVVYIREVARPVPQSGEVLVRVLATTVNRNDCGFRTPEYGLIIRPLHGLWRPRRQVLGTEFAGIVAAVGPDVSLFRVGDAVFGLTGTKFGTHAEFCCVPEVGAIALKPANLSDEEAAAICDGPWLALNLLKTLDFSKVRAVLVNGASGSIGSSCVQLAKNFGAEVTAVCSTRSQDIVKALGADHVIDFEKAHFTRCGQTFDAVIDAVGKSSFSRCAPLLNPGGTYLSSELGPWLENPLLALLPPFLRGKQVRFPLPKLNKADLELIRTLAEQGKLKPIIDRGDPLDEIVDAYRYVGSGQKLGSVVIRVA